MGIGKKIHMRLNAMVSQNYSCQLSNLQLLAIVIKIVGATMESVHNSFKPYRDCMPKLQLPAIITIATSYGYKFSIATRELVHDTFETYRDCIPKLQLPAIRPIAVRCSEFFWGGLRGNQYMIPSTLITIVCQTIAASYPNSSCELQ